MLVYLQSVAILAVAAERASLVKAVLATQSGGITLVYILTCLGVIAQLIAHRARALSPKGSLHAPMGAASVVV